MLALAAVIAMLTSGCASLQQNGSITSVPEDSAGSSQMQIWPSPPSAGELSTAIVSGFLEAARSGASNQGIAADYLTGGARSDWNWDQKRVIVLADYSENYPQSADVGTSDGPDEPGGVALPNQGSSTTIDCDSGPVNVTVSGSLVGALDASGLYSAKSGATTYTFQVSETKAGCRISSLPQVSQGFGVLMERSDFESSYSRHTVYYQNGSAAQLGNLVPAEVYLPSVDTDQTVAQDMSQLIVDHVPAGLSPALADPAIGAVFKSVVLDSSGSATVTIDSNGACAKNSGGCRSLATQLAYTLYSLSTKVSSLTLDDVSSGQSPTVAPSTSAAVYDYGLTAPDSSGQGIPFYAIADNGAVEEVRASGTTAIVSAPTVGTAKTQFKMVSVEPGVAGAGKLLALLGEDGHTVYLTHRQGGTYPLTQVYPTTAIPFAGSVQQMSWDTSGDLWFTVKLNGVVSIYRYGGGELSPVTVVGLSAGQIDRIAAAPDGDRVAVGYSGTAGYSIAITTVDRSPAAGSWICPIPSTRRPTGIRSTTSIGTTRNPSRCSASSRARSRWGSTRSTPTALPYTTRSPSSRSRQARRATRPSSSGTPRANRSPRRPSASRICSTSCPWRGRPRNRCPASPAPGRATSC